jgi:hypothetical protein
MDERLDGGYSKDQATKCVQLARPDSTDIVKILDGEMELPPAPAEFSPLADGVSMLTEMLQTYNVVVFPCYISKKQSFNDILPNM